MSCDMITLFNRLTSTGLADYTLIENILEHHYEKFKYFYKMINDINLNKIDSIHAEPIDDAIIVYIEPHENNYINEIIYTINSRKTKCKNAKYFNVDVIEDDSSLVITISMCGNKKEGEIYADRFI